jgi:hypothetical protein
MMLPVSTTGCGACVDNSYCPTEGGDASTEWIANVLLGTLDNTTGSDGGYGDYTNVSTELMVGLDHDVTLTPGFSGFQFSEWFHVYVDLDHDGDLTGQDELVFDSGSSDNGPVSGILNIPVDATLGPTRMRVSMWYDEAPLSPCEASFDYGEVEDYCVNLIANPNIGLGLEHMTSVPSLFPQPADDLLFLTLSDPAMTNGLSIDVFDGTGRNVTSRSMRGSPAQLSTAELADGVYTYRLSAGGTVIAQGRFMVAHTR